MGFQQGLSGLNATSKNLSVIGNNIANANTIGAKASKAVFADLYANAMSGASGTSPGIGVIVNSVTQQFSQGSITATDNSLDLAINGNGFFQLDAGGTTVYSRNGQFEIDKAGNIVNNAGQKLQGYAAATDGSIIPSTIQALQLPTAGVAPAATANIKLELNLDSRGKITLPAAAPLITFADPKTYNTATSVTVFDTKGQGVAITCYFQKTGADTWNVYGTANGRPLLDDVGDGTGNPLPSVVGMTFASSGGSLTSPVGTVAIDVPAAPLASGGGNSLPIAGVKLDLTGATQFGSSFSVTNLAQDGYAPGQLNGISIDKSGVIKAQYSNGQSKAAGQLVLARFRNPQGLQPLGGNAWASAVSSGEPIVGAAGQGSFGALQSGSLEESNVELTNELVAMITAQRAYQANAQTIKTEDQMLQTLVNLR